jgi:hypothetical protein
MPQKIHRYGKEEIFGAWPWVGSAICAYSTWKQNTKVCQILHMFWYYFTYIIAGSTLVLLSILNTLANTPSRQCNYCLWPW